MNMSIYVCVSTNWTFSITLILTHSKQYHVDLWPLCLFMFHIKDTCQNMCTWLTKDQRFLAPGWCTRPAYAWEDDLLTSDVNGCTLSYTNVVPCVFDGHTCVFMDIVHELFGFLECRFYVAAR